MYNYYVTFIIDGRYCVKVNAASLEEAQELAKYKLSDINLADLDIISCPICTVEDENGEIIYER